LLTSSSRSVPGTIRGCRLHNLAASSSEILQKWLAVSFIQSFDRKPPEPRVLRAPKSTDRYPHSETSLKHNKRQHHAFPHIYFSATPIPHPNPPVHFRRLIMPFTVAGRSLLSCRSQAGTSFFMESVHVFVDPAAVCGETTPLWGFFWPHRVVRLTETVSGYPVPIFLEALQPVESSAAIRCCLAHHTPALQAAHCNLPESQSLVSHTERRTSGTLQHQKTGQLDPAYFTSKSRSQRPTSLVACGSSMKGKIWPSTSGLCVAVHSGLLSFVTSNPPNP
jgi:hypothetical protein